MADDRILELSPETAGRYLETSAPQLIDWGEIQHLDDSAFEPQQDDLFLNHLHSLTSLAFVSTPTPPIADLFISAAPTQQKEQCLMNMTRNEDRVLPADDNKQLSTQTKGISHPGFVASSSTTSDLKRKGKKVHGERQNTKEVEYSRKGKRESNSSSAKKLRRTPNLSEKKRRVRIREQLKNLQELVQLNGKVQQLSILDAAITQIKLLQQEVQDAEASGQCNININMNSAPAPSSNSDFPNN